MPHHCIIYRMHCFRLMTMAMLLLSPLSRSSVTQQAGLVTSRDHRPITVSLSLASKKWGRNVNLIARSFSLNQVMVTICHLKCIIGLTIHFVWSLRSVHTIIHQFIIKSDWVYTEEGGAWHDVETCWDQVLFWRGERSCVGRQCDNAWCLSPVRPG